MADVVTEANDICARARRLAEYRSETYWIGPQWARARASGRSYFLCTEFRNDRSGSTRCSPDPIGSVRVHIDGLTCTCMGCGREFECDADEIEWSGAYPTGIVCCSPECRERYEEDAGTVCAECGEHRPTRLDPHGNAVCSALCASRSFRAAWALEAAKALTIPAPPPTTPGPPVETEALDGLLPAGGVAPEQFQGGDNAVGF